MRKFKIFFYPLYIIIAIVVLYFSIDILANMDAYRERVDFAMLRKLPEYLLYLLLLVSLLMITELISENVHIIRLRRKVKNAEAEVLKLKASLYDRGQQGDIGVLGEPDEAPVITSEAEAEPSSEEAEEGDEEEDEFKL